MKRKVYKCRHGAGSRFRDMTFVDQSWEDFSKWEMMKDASPLLPEWNPMTLRFYEPGETGISGDSKKRPLNTATDMPLILQLTLLTLVSQRFVDRVGNWFTPYGEFLPCDCTNGERYYLYHCMHFVDECAVDKNKSRIHILSKGSIRIYDYAFVPELIDNKSVFRCPIGNTEILFWGGEVAEAIRKAKLAGVTMDLEWEEP